MPPTNWIQQLKAFTAYLLTPLSDYFKNGMPPPSKENELQDLPARDIAALFLIVILLALIPNQ